MVGEYDIELVDIFDIQDAMAKQVAAVMEPELTTIEQQIAFRKPPQNLGAWDCYQRALWHMWAFTTPGFDEAETMFKRAIELEPGLARAHARLSYAIRLWRSAPRLRMPAQPGASRKTVEQSTDEAWSRCESGREAFPS